MAFNYPFLDLRNSLAGSAIASRPPSIRLRALVADAWMETENPKRQHQATTSVREEVSAFLGALGDLKVIVRSWEEVESYFLRFPGLVDIVELAVQAVQKHIQDAQMILDHYRDPEIDDEYLVLCVRASEYDESFLKRLAAAEAEFLEHLNRQQGWLQLTTDFGNPTDAL